MNYEDSTRFRAFLINEYCFCEKLFWLHQNRLSPDNNYENLKIGKAEHVSKEDKNENNWIKYDKLEKGLIIEFVKTKKSAERKKFQLLLYMLRSKTQLGELRVTNTNELILGIDLVKDTKLINELENHISSMIGIDKYNSPPNKEYSEKCSTCSFHEYCWGGK